MCARNFEWFVRCTTETVGTALLYSNTREASNQNSWAGTGTVVFQYRCANKTLIKQCCISTSVTCAPKIVRRQNAGQSGRSSGRWMAHSGMTRYGALCPCDDIPFQHVDDRAAQSDTPGFLILTLIKFLPAVCFEFVHWDRIHGLLCGL
jgi:hypothetical protein